MQVCIRACVYVSMCVCVFVCLPGLEESPDHANLADDTTEVPLPQQQPHPLSQDSDPATTTTATTTTIANTTTTTATTAWLNHRNVFRVRWSGEPKMS